MENPEDKGNQRIGINYVIGEPLAGLSVKEISDQQKTEKSSYDKIYLVNHFVKNWDHRLALLSYDKETEVIGVDKHDQRNNSHEKSRNKNALQECHVTSLITRYVDGHSA